MLGILNKLSGIIKYPGQCLKFNKYFFETKQEVQGWHPRHDGWVLSSLCLARGAIATLRTGARPAQTGYCSHVFSPPPLALLEAYPLFTLPSWNPVPLCHLPHHPWSCSSFFSFPTWLLALHNDRHPQLKLVLRSVSLVVSKLSASVTAVDKLFRLD